jgi:hypothetical protein
MIPHHVYYQLAVIGFLWLCIMLHYTWPSRSAVSPTLPTEPRVAKKLMRPRTRSISAARQAAHDTATGLPVPCLG